MEQTPFSDKVSIIAEAYDLGAPLCVAIYNGGAVANDVGEEWIEQAWEGFCELMQIDKYGKYDDWDSILDFLDDDDE